MNLIRTLCPSRHAALLGGVWGRACPPPPTLKLIAFVDRRVFVAQTTMPPLETAPLMGEEEAIAAALKRSNDAAVWDAQPLLRTKASSVPPKGYRCVRCSVEGHYVQNCPTNGNPEFDRKRKYMKGVPLDRIDSSTQGGRLVAQDAVFARQMWFLRGGDIAIPDASAFTIGAAPVLLALPAPPRMPTQPIGSQYKKHN